MPPTKLLETYATRITISPDEPTLTRLLNDEVVPSLLIRQSALIRLDADATAPIYAQNVEAAQLPSAGQIPTLLNGAGLYRLPAPEAAQPLPWVRLALALCIERKPIGRSRP